MEVHRAVEVRVREKRRLRDRAAEADDVLPVRLEVLLAHAEPARAELGVARRQRGDLAAPQHLAPGERVVSFADPGTGRTTVVRGSRASVLHAHDAARSLPLLVEVNDRELADVGGLSGHRGEESCYVLSGTLVLHLEGQPPRIMKAGASALFDSATPHAYLSGAKGGAKILIVVVRGFRGREAEPGAPNF